MSARETVELVDGSVYWSDDHWRTIWRQRFVKPPHSRGRLGGVVLTDKAEIDRIRYIAIVQHGGGRDETKDK